MKLNDVRLTTKLPLAFVALSLAVALCMSWMGYRDFRTSLVEQTHKRLEILTNERSIALESWFGSLDAQVMGFAVDPSVIGAIQGFSSTFGLLMEDPVADLHRTYIDENPNPIGEKDLLGRAAEQIPYNFQHAEYHPYFRSIKNSLELYDIFLFNMNGDLVYSVYKEADFATNFAAGPYAESGLGRAYDSALQAPPGEAVFEDFSPYAPSAGAPAAFLAVAVRNPQDEPIGVFAIQVPADAMSGIVNNDVGLSETGELTMFSPNLRARTKSRFPDGHQILDELKPAAAALEAFETGTAQYDFETSIAGNPAMGVAHKVAILGQDWVILGEFELSEVYEDAIAQRNKTFAFTMGSMSVVALVGWIISRAFTTPLTSIVAAMKKISERNYDVDIPDTGRRDEIGDLSRVLEMLADRLKAFDSKLAAETEIAEAQNFAVTELGSGLQRLSAGDFTKTLDHPFSAEFDALRGDFNNSIVNLGSTMSNLKRFSIMIGDQTGQMSNESNELSRRTENQAATLEETAAAIDQITGTISESTEELRSAEKLIIEVNDDAKKGRVVVGNTTSAMGEIEKSSEEIGSIIRVVDDIAFQTNLLALNAGVEAARAGEAGRGFAVVAAEVRQLAMRSTEAVGQIKGLVETSATNVQTGVNLVRDTERVLLEIVQRIDSLATLIQSVTENATDQAGSIGEINVGVNNLDRVTQQNAQMVDNSNASVQTLRAEATNLVELLRSFAVRDGVENVVSFNASGAGSDPHIQEA